MILTAVVFTFQSKKAPSGKSNSGADGAKGSRTRPAGFYLAEAAAAEESFLGLRETALIKQQTF